MARRNGQIFITGNSGFPKSMNISMAIDKAAGAKRPDRKIGKIMDNQIMLPMRAVLNPGTPVTEEAKRWEGWGTALKPAHEPVVVARKPVQGRVVANVLKYGTGGINVKDTRIGDSGGAGRVIGQVGPAMSPGWGMKKAIVDDTVQGRWPPNIILSHSPLCRESDDGDVICDRSCSVAEMNSQACSDDAGQFFPCFRYVPKPGNSERNAGLVGLKKRTVNESLDDDAAGRNSPRAGAGRNGARENFHPTVKPIDLMSWLCKLVTPPGGVVLDPFLGSGTTGIAALRNGFAFVGIELDKHYFVIARNRIKNDSPMLNEVIPVRFKARKKKITKAKKKRSKTKRA